jgi:transcriptional regulator with GAF, ATPase, and Fis domain
MFTLDPSMIGLFIRKGLGSGSFLPLEPGFAPYILGRSADASLRLEDEGVSRIHAEINVSNGRWRIRDLNSRNGTYLNSLLVHEHGIEPRDVIVLGTAELVVVSRDPVSETNADLAALERSGTADLAVSPLIGVVGQAHSMQGVLDAVRRVAPLDVTVVVRGESGTGKELVARAIHSMSGRRSGPFLAVNCGAIPEALVDSELFGHEKGAFTGATTQRAGRFEEASGGTLFLDEVGDLPSAAQVSLLRVLQEGSIRRVGGSKDIRVDVRIVAATHRDLEAAVRARTFRNDLYHRLCIFEVALPPLRERLGDLPLLAEHFLAEFGLVLGRGPLRLSESSLGLLRAHSWPGNIRELRNVLERAAIRGRSELIEPEDIEISSLGAGPESAAAGSNRFVSAVAASEDALDSAPGTASGDAPDASEDAGSPSGADALGSGESLLDHLSHREADLVRATLEAVSWNQSEAARRLGVSEAKIRKCVRQYGLRPGASASDA